MLCVRCSHTLPPRADRCVRCFALNPENRPAPVSRALHDSGPAAPVAVSIASDPPMAPVALCFDDERTPSPQPLTEPDPAPVRTPRFAVPEPRPKPPVPPPRSALPLKPMPPQPKPARAPASARLLAWSLDATLICATAAVCIAASLRVSHVRYPLDFLRDAAPLFGALVVITAVAYSSLLTALCGRTPGMSLAGHHLRTLEGDAPTPSRALLRAVLALPSAALGLFGFVLALVDRRGQTLHDKLCRCITIVD